MYIFSLGLDIPLETIKLQYSLVPEEPEDETILLEKPEEFEESELKEDGRPEQMEQARRTRFLDNIMCDNNARYSDLDNLCIFFDETSAVMDKKCLLNLGKVDIDIVGDEVLTENFCDQEGRLVCLVCYKIMGPSEFQVYRDHVKEHEQKQLEKVSIIMPNIGRGGPGIKKKFLSDAEIDEKFLNPEKDMLECTKCMKVFEKTEKIIFRKHLHYHSHKEKNYVYQCSQCSKEFNDQSNLKRHMHCVHEKQLFR